LVKTLGSAAIVEVVIDVGMITGKLGTHRASPSYSGSVSDAAFGAT
jgi:hypothetical protein